MAASIAAMAGADALAYVFWHRPRAGVDRAEYEGAQRAFHERLAQVESACFRLTELPFAAEHAPAGSDGYEDWYLVEDWAALGELNAAAVDARHRDSHDRAAALVGGGWAGVYGLVRGAAEIPAEASWMDKPPGEPSEEFVANLPAVAVWRRQMVLGPAPEFCLAAPEVNRQRVG